jgi:hypothetical protein
MEVSSTKGLEVINQLVQGLSNKEIASALGIPIRTVKGRLYRLFAGYGFKSGDKRIKLAVFAYREMLWGKGAFTTSKEASSQELSLSNKEEKESPYQHSQSVSGLLSTLFVKETEIKRLRQLLEQQNTLLKTISELSLTKLVSGPDLNSPCGTNTEDGQTIKKPPKQQLITVEKEEAA